MFQAAGLREMTACPLAGASRQNTKQTELANVIIMKKYILIAAAIVASVGFALATNSLQKVEDHSKCEAGFKCTSCSGTGWRGQIKCVFCKGSGANSSY